MGTNEMKSAEKKRMVEKMGELKKKKKHFSAELEAVEQYLKDLKPACVYGGDQKEKEALFSRVGSSGTVLEGLKTCLCRWGRSKRKRSTFQQSWKQWNST